MSLVKEGKSEPKGSTPDVPETDNKTPDIGTGEENNSQIKIQPLDVGEESLPLASDAPGSPESPESIHETSDDAEPVKGPNWRRRILIGLAVFLVVILIAVTALYLRLSSGSMSSEILTQRVTQRIHNALPEDISIDFDDISISVDPLRGLLANVSNPVLKDNGRGLSAQSKNLSVGIGLTALLRGAVQIRDIEIAEPFVSVQMTSGSQRSIQEQLDFSGEATNAAAMSTPLARIGNGLSDLHGAASKMLSIGAEQGLRRVTILEGAVSVSRPSGRRQNFRSIDATINVTPSDNTISARAAGVGLGGSWRFEGSAKPVEDGPGHEINLALYDIILPEIIPALGRENFSLRTDAPLNLSMRSKFVDENAVPTASFDAEIGSSYLHIGERDLALLDKGHVSLIWSPELDAISVESATLSFGQTVLPFEGFIRSSENNPLNELDIRLVARDAVLAPHDVIGTPPLNMELIGVNGRFDIASRYLSVDLFEVRTGQATITGSTNVNFQSQFPSLAGAVSTTPISVDELKHIWPPTLAGGARRWFVRNVREGRVDGADMTFAIPAGLVGNRDPNKVFPKSAFAGNLNFSGAQVKTFGDLPDLSAEVGHLGFNEFGLTVSVEKGSAVSPSGEVVDVPSAVFRLPILGPKNPEAQAVVSMIGKAKDLAEIADAKPLGFMTKRGVPPQGIAGDAVAEVNATFNLSRKIEPQDVATVATVRLSNFSSEAPIQDRFISEGDVVVQINAAGTSVRGNAKLDGLAANVDLFLPNAGADGLKTDIRLVLTDAQRKKLGIDLGEMLTGPTPVEVGKVNLDGSRPISVDLKSARLSLASVGWSKGVGVPATLTFLFKDTGDGQTLENIQLSGDGFSAAGRADLSKARGLERLQLSNISLRRGDKASLEIRRTAQTAYLISINGEQIDARGLVRAVKKNTNDGTGGEGIDFAIDGKVARLAGFGGQIVSNAEFSLQSDGGVPSVLQFTGRQASGTDVSAIIEGGSGTSWLSMNAQDGGSMLSFLDVTDSVKRGSLSVSASLGKGNAATVGQVFLSDFEVGGSESLDQLARAVPRNGSQTNTPTVRKFEQARMDFTLRNGRLVMDDAQVRGPAMGVTLNGSVDLKASNLRLNGVYVPAYGLNNAFSRIPIFGTIVGGDRNQGLLGVTFRVSGNLDDPLLTVNPISAIAPGIFRRIFEFR